MRENSDSGRGFSLVELLVSIAAGLVVSSAALAFVMSSFKANGEYVLSTRLSQELRNTLDLVVGDLQRAGYDDDALAYLSNESNSPFAPIQLLDSAFDTDTLPDCVIYAYDRTNPNGSTTAGGAPGVVNLDNGEVRGLRRVTATVNGNEVGIIEYAVSSGTARPTCADATATYTSFPPACVGTWCALSDPTTLDISTFSVVDNGPSLNSTSAGVTTTMGVRRLDIAMAGKLAGNNDFTRDLRTMIAVRANCIRNSATFTAVCEGSP